MGYLSRRVVQRRSRGCRENRLKVLTVLVVQALATPLPYSRLHLGDKAGLWLVSEKESSPISQPPRQDSRAVKRVCSLSLGVSPEQQGCAVSWSSQQAG